MLRARSSRPSPLSPEPTVNTFIDRFVRDRLRSRSCTQIGFPARAGGRVWMHGGGTVRFGRGVLLDASRAPIELHAGLGAIIEFGDGVTIHGGTSIESLESVTIGTGSVIGAWSKIIDNQFHQLDGDRADLPESRPVWIGPNVRIGERCIVLPGTRVEAAAQLGHGVVIGRRVPPGAVLEGSPPRRIASGGAR